MKKTYSRVTALIAGSAMLLVNGLIYAWSIYSGPLSEEFGWTSAQLGMCFTVILASFCIGGLIGGSLTAKKGIGVTIPLGGIMSCLGVGICNVLSVDRLWLLYVSFCLAGLGVGMVYNAILGAVVCRFPDKKGSASGIMLMGFGASSLVIGSAASALMYSPVGWRTTYLLTGVLLLAVALVGRIFLNPPEVAACESESPAQAGMTPAQMIRTSSFWVFFIFAMIGCAFGAGIIAHARYIALEAGAAASLATLTVGLISVMNGLGRITFGFLYDKKGFFVALLCDNRRLPCRRRGGGVFPESGARVADGYRHDVLRPFLRRHPDHHVRHCRRVLRAGLVR
jgi:OFA family oxalate/formate antiporter-like MFS transporter